MLYHRRVRENRYFGWIPRLAGLLGLLTLSGCMPPTWAAPALLHPGRKPVTGPPPMPAETVRIAGDGVTLEGWLFRAHGDRRGTIVYLHGVADNRTSATVAAKRFVQQGYDVLAYDSRALGNSTGDACTYGYYASQFGFRHLQDARELGGGNAHDADARFANHGQIGQCSVRLESGKGNRAGQ